MKEINTVEEINEIINNNKMAVIYFTGRACGACEVVKDKIEVILKRWPLIVAAEINGEKNIELSAKYDVFSLPIFLLFIDGKECIRIGKNVDLLQLEKDIYRYYEMIYS